MTYNVFSGTLNPTYFTYSLGSHPLLISELTSGRMLASGATGSKFSFTWAMSIKPVHVIIAICHQCFDAVGCVAGRAFGLLKTEW